MNKLARTKEYKEWLLSLIIITETHELDHV